MGLDLHVPACRGPSRPPVCIRAVVGQRLAFSLHGKYLQEYTFIFCRHCGASFHQSVAALSRITRHCISTGNPVGVMVRSIMAGAGVDVSSFISRLFYVWSFPMGYASHSRVRPRSWAGVSTQFLKVALGYQAFHVALPDIELAIFRQVDGTVVLCISPGFCNKNYSWRPRRASLPIFRLDLPRISQHPHINEQISWGLEAPR